MSIAENFDGYERATCIPWKKGVCFFSQLYSSWVYCLSSAFTVESISKQINDIAGRVSNVPQ